MCVKEFTWMKVTIASMKIWQQLFFLGLDLARLDLAADKDKDKDKNKNFYQKANLMAVAGLDLRVAFWPGTPVGVADWPVNFFLQNPISQYIGSIYLSFNITIINFTTPWFSASEKSGGLQGRHYNHHHQPQHRHHHHDYGNQDQHRGSLHLSKRVVSKEANITTI